MTLQPRGDRNLIPRWRDPASTARQGELASLNTRQREPLTAESLGARESEWASRHTLRFATDLVGGALVVGSTPMAVEAAHEVLASRKASPLARAVASHLLSPTETQAVIPSEIDAPDAVRMLKQRLTQDPRNTLAWTEISRYYTIQGQSQRAKQAMRIALALTPNHRYVLRAASRLAVHNGDFDRSHEIVERSPATRSDPWLLATEIATAEVAGVRSKLIKTAVTMLDRDTFSPRALSELASALGTLEIRSAGHSSFKKAKRLLARSLAEPNENTIAHGQWATRHVRGLIVPPAQVATSAEALALQHADDRDWEKALGAAWRWLYDQPFSSGPAELGSYQASLGQAFDEGVRIARAGLQANPGEFLLTNNLAFCLIKLGNLDEADAILERFEDTPLAGDERATFVATKGLLAYRRGDSERGRELYAQAIADAKDKHAAGIALIMFAAEELRSCSPLAADAVERAKAVGASRHQPSDLTLWLRHLPDS